MKASLSQCVKPAQQQQQRRAFYLGAMRGNHGRKHPALADIPQVQAKPDEQMNFATWRALWKRGPLFTKVGEDDEAMAWRRYLRKTATDHEKHKVHGWKVQPCTEAQKRHNREIAEAVEWNERLWEKRFDVEEGWASRSSLDWQAVTSDTAARLLLWEVFGPIENHAAPLSTPPVAALQAVLHAECKRRGELPMAAQRLRELFVEASYHAVLFKKEDLLAALPESLVHFSRDTMEGWLKSGGRKELNPHRQVLTGFFVNYPTSKVEIPGVDDLQALDLEPYLPLLCWFKNEVVPKYSTDKAYCVAKLYQELEVRTEMAKQMSAKWPDTPTKALDDDIQKATDALKQMERMDEKAWRGVLRNLNKPARHETAHVLNAIPLKPVPDAPAPKTQHLGLPILSEAAQRDAETCTQNLLNELLCNPTYKKCLLVDHDDRVRTCLYDLAWVLARERAHDIYSEQRKEVNEMTQKARRRLHVAVSETIANEASSGLFDVEENTPDRTDILFAPDPYAHDIANSTVTLKHIPFAGGDYLDKSIGVRT
ncbi:hypothetical protein DIPPA_14606 [Diplonema papillatum]|nr:hypothetical protein DIPPA_14606 [Diplonema papillatum]